MSVKQLTEKWKPVMDEDVTLSECFSPEAIQAQLLENTEKWCHQNQHQLRMDESTAPTNMGGNNLSANPGSPSNGTANIASWQPVLIAMAKRLPPNQVAFNFMSVQPMKTPDQQIFAMRARYLPSGLGSTEQQVAPGGTGATENKTLDKYHGAEEALFHEAKAGFSGNGNEMLEDSSGFTSAYINSTGDTAAQDALKTAQETAVALGGMDTAQAERLGSGVEWAKMGVTVEKSSVSAKSRGLFADYSHELRQDMMAVHGEDVDSILSDMLVTEIQAEMNREFIRKMNLAAVLADQGMNVKGVLNMSTDVSGRWALEKWKYMLFQLEIEANQIAKQTRRGKGNRVLCSANVASALAMAGMLDYTPALASQSNLSVDVTGQTYAGRLANGMDVHIDPYASIEFITIAYKGASNLDAGAIYCPYTPLEMYRASGEDSFQPRMAFKTRYGITGNPFVKEFAAGQNVANTTGLEAQSNPYFRKFAITNLF